MSCRFMRACVLLTGHWLHIKHTHWLFYALTCWFLILASCYCSISHYAMSGHACQVPGSCTASIHQSRQEHLPRHTRTYTEMTSQSTTDDFPVLVPRTNINPETTRLTLLNLGTIHQVGGCSHWKVIPKPNHTLYSSLSVRF